jgi:DNA-binding response OmpR family regulator
MSTILVVDDEPHIRDIVGSYLAREGHDVRYAADGDTALATALADGPDLIVLDVMLPGRSGFDVLRELRAAGRHPAVIMLTARDDVIDRVAGLEIGADDYVTKPFEPRELVARVGAVLRRAASNPIAPPGTPGQSAATRAYLDLEIDEPAREVRPGASTSGSPALSSTCSSRCRTSRASPGPAGSSGIGCSARISTPLTARSTAT